MPGADAETSCKPDPHVWPGDLPRYSIALRHTYASLCVAAGIKPIDIAELVGHRDVKTTLTVYAHLINSDDHAGNMAALGALATGPTPSYSGNVVPLHG